MVQATATRAPAAAPITAVLLLCAMSLTISTGLRQSFGLFLSPMGALGISASSYGFAIALQAIVWGISQPVIGLLADRYGTRPVMATTALIFAAGLAVMGAADGVVGLDLGAGLLVGIGIAGTGLGVVVGMVSRAVPSERRSQTVGLVAAIGSLGTFVLAPLGQWMIDTIGWRGALYGFAGVAASMALFALRLREPARLAHAGAVEPTIGATLLLAARHPGYLTMTAAYFACGFQLMFITVHLPAYLGSCGIAPALGATAIGLIGLFNAPGTWIAGQLGARYSRKRLLASVYLLRTAIIMGFVALPISPASTLVFTAALGFLWLSVSPLVSGLVDKVFGLRHFGTLYGLVFLSHQLGSFCGALLGGLVFDATGSYAIAWIALITIGLTAFALQWPMDDRAPGERTALARQAGRAHSAREPIGTSAPRSRASRAERAAPVATGAST